MSKVLIIEDEKAMSDLITIKFNVEGFEVVQAFSLAEAKSKLATQAPFDLVLLDYLLPDGNSTELLREISKNPKTANTPVVLMTNYIEDVNMEQMKSLGVKDVFAKYQVVPAQMVDRVKKVIGK